MPSIPYLNRVDLDSDLGLSWDNKSIIPDHIDKRIPMPPGTWLNPA